MSDMMTTSSLATADYRLLWAKSKPRHPLWKHLLDASAVSLALAPPVISFGWGAEVTALLVGLHDIGKADSSFQHQIPDFSRDLAKAGYPVTGDARCRHERISARFIKNKLVKEGLNPFAADAVSRTVVAHHGYWNETARAVGQEYAEAQNQLCQMLQQVLDLKALPSESPADLSAFGMRLAGHIVLCDWIASNEEFFGDARLRNVDEPKDYFATAREVASDWVGRLGLERDQQAGKASCIVETARPIQQTLLDKEIPPRLVIIEAPMGEGKTEAAWILAEKWRDKGYHGMYMALPTMATSDSLHGRYRDDYLRKLGHGEDAKLVHGMAWLRDDDDKEPEKLSEVGEPGDDRSLAAAWFRPTRRAMLAAHGVGTVDQAMLAGMNVKFGFLRLYGLADRVLVIDEVHAYDAYMSAIIARLLQWGACLKIPVILLSATLSAKQRAAMNEAYGATGGDPGPNAPYPLITVAEPGKEAWTVKADASSSRTLKIETHPGVLGDAKKTAAKAAELVKNGGCCCVILNTVKQAQAVYQTPVLETLPKLLFHARFTAADRETITNRVLDMFGKGRWEGEGENRRFRPAERPDEFVLVATQVVEQSLDVDFDHMISEIAPMDLLLQRSGRIKRHARTKDGKLKDKGDDERGQPELHVLLPMEDTPKFGASEIIYRRYPLLRTLKDLKGKDQIKLPEEFRPLIEAVYGNDLPANASEYLRTAKQEWDDLQEDLAAQAGEFLLCEPMADEFDPVGADEVGDDSDDGNGWRARTRLGLEDVLVIPLSAKQVEKYKTGDLHPRLVKRLYKQSVKIPPYYWPPRPAKGYDKPELGEKKLRGVWLLPVKVVDGGWKWEGTKEDKKPYEIKYDPTIGLTHGGDK